MAAKFEIISLSSNLKQQIAELESELVGARLDAKYLDKELAGRIQQIQILLASNASQAHKEQVIQISVLVGFWGFGLGFCVC